MSSKTRWTGSDLFLDLSFFQSRIGPWSKDKATLKKGVILKIQNCNNRELLGDELPFFSECCCISSSLLMMFLITT